ncbi:E3 ubiquitin-protein ligase Topors [Aythya fuligula]|uniref:E3 ubiquitin-protein ligase Topors n=1 Tax=Aythya fuligula TaxID=219594 RepID=A0A6J3EER9_AYTFU|nr:E3 ubiquitin-protein ligase Topors [Aythya fuligula]
MSEPRRGLAERGLRRRPGREERRGRGGRGRERHRERNRERNRERERAGNGFGRCRARHKGKAAAAELGRAGREAGTGGDGEEFPEDDDDDDDSSPRPSTSRQRRIMPASASPDAKCPICLDKFDNVAYLDRCLHRFCFHCVQEWSKSKAECPLCKQPFNSIFHTVRAEDDFQEFVLNPMESGSFASPDGRRFRYRTTLTRERRELPFLQSSASSRLTVSSPDNGVLFEGLPSQPLQQRQQEIQQMLRRLASRRQASAEGRSTQQIPEEEMISFRRALYRTGVRIRSVQDGGRYRDISAEFFHRNPACLHRLVPWLRRELTVLFGGHGSLINIAQHIIMNNVTIYDMESDAFADELRPFLLNRTEHFLHEFISFARCPFNLDAYDQHANYDCPAPSYDEGSHTDSSIITISPDEANAHGPNRSSSMTSIGQAPWDDETPGPSYSIAEDIRTTIASPLVTSESSDEDSAARRTLQQAQLQANAYLNDSDSSPDNCVIVGYVKPLAERTPELVELSSDSEESIREERREDIAQQQPVQCRSWSDSEQSRSSSPRFPTYNEIVGSCRSSLSPAAEKTELNEEKNEDRANHLSPQNSTWSPSLEREATCSPFNHRWSRETKPRSPQAFSQNSQDSHGHGSEREHHSKRHPRKRRSRSRDSGKHRNKRSRRRSRSRDRSGSRRSRTGSPRSQRGSPSRESTTSRELSRSRSLSRGRGRRRSRSRGRRSRSRGRRSRSRGRRSRSRDWRSRSRHRSRSRDKDHYYLKDGYQGKYHWGYAFYSRKKDGEDSSCRKDPPPNAHNSKQSASPECKIQSFTERKDPHSQEGLHERHYCYYERCRSRSRSSDRSRSPPAGADRTKTEKPGGKRKYKTRHLESAAKGSTSQERENDHRKNFLKFKYYCKNEDNLSDNRESSETRHKKKKKRMRSPSVEIVYEGKTTDPTKHMKKKKKKHKKKHRKHHAHSSPVVITIDSDSGKEPESTGCDSNVTSTGTASLNEQENESLSSLMGMTGCDDVYRASEETGESAGNCNIPTRSDFNPDTSNADTEPQEAADKSLVADASSSSTTQTETVTSHGQEAQATPSGQLSSPGTSLQDYPERPALILRLPKRFVNKSCRLESPDKNM